VYSPRAFDIVKSELEAAGILRDLPLLKPGVLHTLSFELSFEGEAVGRILDVATGAAASTRGADVVLLVRAMPPDALAATAPHQLLVTAIAAQARGVITHADIAAVATSSNNAVSYLRAVAVAGSGVAAVDVQGKLEALHSAAAKEKDVRVRKFKNAAAEL
jgi:hypothetical protein